MGGFRLEVPLAIQIGAVVVLFAAALGTLWFTSSAVVEREERRVVRQRPLEGGERPARSTGQGRARRCPAVPRFHGGRRSGQRLDRRLSEEAGRIRERLRGIEGGYYVPSLPEQPYLPALPSEPRQSEAREGSRFPVSPPSPPRRNLYDYVDTQVDAAYRKRNELSVVEDIPPYTIAIRTAPVRVNGRVVAATWTMTRLVDPIYIDQSARGYRWFAGLASRDRPLTRPDRPPGADGRTTGGGARAAPDRVAAERAPGGAGKLIAGVAHEVRNPLAGIRGITQLWRRGLGLGNEGFDHLIDEVDRLEGIVSRLLQFSRADAQDLPRATSTSWRPRPCASPRPRAGRARGSGRGRPGPDLPPSGWRPRHCCRSSAT